MDGDSPVVLIGHKRLPIFPGKIAVDMDPFIAGWFVENPSINDMGVPLFQETSIMETSIFRMESLESRWNLAGKELNNTYQTCSLFEPTSQVQQDRLNSEGWMFLVSGFGRATKFLYFRVFCIEQRRLHITWYETTGSY